MSSGQDADPIRPGELTFDQIKRYLPHRHPFLFIDRVLVLEARRRAVGLKSVSGNDPVFEGHFPEVAIFPGVLMVECLAQLAGIMLGGHQEEPQIGMLAKINRFNFKDLVKPGDTMRVKCIDIDNIGRVRLSRKAALNDDAAAE